MCLLEQAKFPHIDIMCIVFFKIIIILILS